MKPIYPFLFQPNLHTVDLAVSKFKEEMTDRMGDDTGENISFTQISQITRINVS